MQLYCKSWKHQSWLSISGYINTPYSLMDGLVATKIWIFCSANMKFLINFIPVCHSLSGQIEISKNILNSQVWPFSHQKQIFLIHLGPCGPLCESLTGRLVWVEHEQFVRSIHRSVQYSPRCDDWTKLWLKWNTFSHPQLKGSMGIYLVEGAVWWTDRLGVRDPLCHHFASLRLDTLHSFYILLWLLVDTETDSDLIWQWGARLIVLKKKVSKSLKTFGNHYPAYKNVFQTMWKTFLMK